jgi:murein DD-endopeptidase MepM/ murein hydrolase activator NlpD
MKYWPVPLSYEKTLPSRGSSGVFWEDRGDRHHCGIDIYAPTGCNVIAIEEGIVLETGVFTSPDGNPYWTITYFILIRHRSGLVAKYAELGEALVKSGEEVTAGQVIGRVGSVLDLDKIGEDSPLYIQDLKKTGKPSMLHFELYQSHPGMLDQYLGGNVFNRKMPDFLLDPSEYLRSIPKV